MHSRSIHGMYECMMLERVFVNCTGKLIEVDHYAYVLSRRSPADHRDILSLLASWCEPDRNSREPHALICRPGDDRACTHHAADDVCHESAQRARWRYL